MSKENLIAELRNSMRKTQDEKRYEHTLGVAYTSACLASCHGTDIEKAMIAGLLHDCAKNMDNEKKIKICKKNKIEINETEQKNPFLLHAKVGEYLAHSKYGIEDEDILHAIASHTTGRPGMSKLEIIVFIADYIEPGRTHSPSLPNLRKLAFQDLDLTLLEILKESLEFLTASGKDLDPMTRLTYDYYMEKSRKGVV